MRLEPARRSPRQVPSVAPSQSPDAFPHGAAAPRRDAVRQADCHAWGSCRCDSQTLRIKLPRRTEDTGTAVQDDSEGKTVQTRGGSGRQTQQGEGETGREAEEKGRGEGKRLGSAVPGKEREEEEWSLTQTHVEPAPRKGE
ncbi:unnamed protein product [Lampetra fluviatilis]